MTDLTLTGVDNDTLSVIWDVPHMPNGYIAVYTVIIVNNITSEGNNVFNVSSELTYTNISGLSKFINMQSLHVHVHV